MFTGKTKIDKAIQANLDRWQKRVRDPLGPTNEEMARQAIQQLYLLTVKKPPDLIVFCDSPYQMATVALLITNLVEADNWPGLCRRMSKENPGTQAWEKQWRIEWQRLLENDIKDLSPRVLERQDFYSVEEPVIKAAVANLESSLREGLAANVLQPGSMAWKKPQKKVPGRPLSVPFEWEFFKQAMQMGQKLEAAAGLKINPLNGNTWMALSTGSLDPRWLAKLIPATEEILLPKHPSDLLASCESIRHSCEEFERRCLQMSVWYSRLPGREPAPTPEFDVDLESPLGVPQVFSHLSRGIAHVQEAQKRAAESLEAQLPWMFWMPFAASWLPFALSCRLAYPGIFQSLDEAIDSWALLSHAAAGYCLTPNVAFVCKKPLIFRLNQNDRPHNEDGPAMVWKDSYSVYSWRGVIIRGELLSDKDALSLDKISSARNAELRRVMIDIYGEGRYLEDAGAKLIDKDMCGELYRMDLKGDEPLCMVKVKNSTAEPDGTYKNYFLRVPPFMRTARQAVAWTFDLTESEYHPGAES